MFSWHNACHVLGTVASKADNHRKVRVSPRLVHLSHSCQHVHEKGSANTSVNDACQDKLRRERGRNGEREREGREGGGKEVEGEGGKGREGVKRGEEKKPL